MGSFVYKDSIGIKTYTLFSKNGYKQVLSLGKLAQRFTFSYVGKEKHQLSYIDGDRNLLESAGLSLCRVVEGNKVYFQVEMQDYGNNPRNIRRDEKVFIHNIGPRDSVKDHIFFLADGIKSMFSTPIFIDVENILKDVETKLEMTSTKTIYKVFSGKGFKAELVFEEIVYKNFETRRGGALDILTIKQTSSKMSLDEFNEFTSIMEKYCKELLPLNNNLYQTIKRLTK